MQEPVSQGRRPFVQRLRQAWVTAVRHIKKHAGVGTVCAVAYFDPGNWGVDLQAGSQFGYHLLFVILVAGICAAFLQVLASRLGCVTGLDLASHSRILLYNRPKHKLVYRWLGLYPLYVISEVAIIATDLAELLGSAIALSLLFPKLELWHGVLITAFDVIFIIGMGDPVRGRPVRMFELLIAALVLAVLICMIIIIAKVHVDWGNAFQGYIPSKHIFSSGGIYTSVGIVGATVMPHSLFLGSALATQDRICFRTSPYAGNLGTTNSKETDETSPIKPSKKVSYLRRLLDESKEYIVAAFRKPPASLYATSATRYSERENNPFDFVRAHVYHAIFDVVGSLLGFAVMINSLILMLASAVFFYGNHSTGSASPASLFDAHDLIRDNVGKSAATLFAIALLAAGQSSSIIATVAGQVVSEGFLKWRVSAVMRRVITRCLAIIPSMAIAISIGRPGINVLLVASQVVLSIALPFIILPLLYCTSSKSIMRVRKIRTETIDTSATFTAIDVPPEGPHCPDRDSSTTERAEDEMVDYSNNKIVVVLAASLWVIIVAANMYVIVELGLGGLA